MPQPAIVAGMTTHPFCIALNQAPATDLPRCEALGLALQAEGGAPARIHLLPRGPEIQGRDGRRFRLSDPQRVIAAFNASGLPIPVDYEHGAEQDPDGTPRPAAGWIERLELADDGIWGTVSWTTRGAELVGNREYRFISPALLIDPKTKEILALASAGLVHRPNLYLTALNRSADNPEPPMLKEILAALGLAETASAADAVVAINALKSEKTVALNAAEHPPIEKFIPRTQHDQVVTQLNEARQKITDFERAANEKRANDLVDEAVKAGKVAPAAKDHFLQMALNAFESTKAAIEAMPAVLQPGADPKLKNDPDPGAGALTDQQKALCRQLGLDEAEFAKA
jgi:phage I-like protein